MPMLYYFSFVYVSLQINIVNNKAMSELKKARQRLNLKAPEIQIRDRQFDFTQKSFTRSPHSQSIPKFEVRKDHTNYERYSEMEEFIQDEIDDDFSRYSPQFSRTGRVYGRTNDEDNFGNRSQRISLFKKEPSRQRRGTQYTKIYGQNMKNQQIPQFSQKQRSIYNESPGKIVKNTVHQDSLNLVISNPPIRHSHSPNKPKQCDKDLIQLMIRQQKSNNNSFTDVMFPPKTSIVFNKKYMYLEEGLKFQRLTKIYENSKLRVIKYCQPTFLIMGKFTSPAVYSALTILAEEPTRILNCIGNQQINQNGIYYVHICKDGIWRYIMVDDYLPVKIFLKRSLMFCHTIAKDNTHQSWPALMQKALSKIYGTYQDLFLTAEKGVEPIIRAFTGYPTSTYILNKDFRAFLVLIDAAIKKKQIVVLQNIVQQEKQTGHLKKLQLYQSYQIIEVKKTYIVIRNLAQKQLYTKLSFQQAMIFEKLLIFRNQMNFQYQSYKLRHKKKFYAILKVTVQQRTKCYWEIWENNEAYYKNHIGSNIEYSKSAYQIILKAQKNEEQTYDSVGQDTVIKESGKQVQMKKGVYWVYMHLCQAREQDFVVSYYGEANIKMERVKNMEKWQLQCSC